MAGVRESRGGVQLSSLDSPLFDGAGATKRDLVDYLDAVAEVLLPGLRDRPLTVLRARPGQQPFMQKNVPSHAPDWIRTTVVRSQAAQRDVRYALCDDRRTLLWFANQRAVEYHPTLLPVGVERASSLVLDLDPPVDDAYRRVVAAARLVERALADAGLAAAVKTSGAKGLHVVVPLEPTAVDDAAAATRALAARAAALDPDLATTAFLKDDRGGRVFVDSTRAGGATIAAAYSPRVRPGVPVSFPVGWADLDAVTPSDFTLRTVPAQLGGHVPWHERMPAPQALPADLITEGHAIPVARVQAMHEGKRRARARRS